ncbi:MAG: serine acetyltransferase [Firmicutes bacterium]|nr:serine acetyltransferase [Bacillota bacterium]
MLRKLTGSLRELARNIFIGPDARAFWAHRQKYFNSRNKIIKAYHKLCCARILYKNNAAIPLQTRIKGKINFPHGLNGILISEGAVIGRNCTVYQQVTIGSNTLKDSKKAGAPTIGDNVYIGAGAKIIGGVKIGDNVRIGANCVVVEDIPPNCTVVLEKPRIIVHQEQKDNTFISYADFMAATVQNSPQTEDVG